MKRIDALTKLRQVLLKRRDALRRSVAAELAFMGTDREQPEGDEAYSQAAEIEGRELAAVEEALSRMREGRYGECEGCGANISLQRLEALPDATYCIRCQRDSETYRPAPVIPRRRLDAIDLADHVA